METTNLWDYWMILDDGMMLEVFFQFDTNILDP